MPRTADGVRQIRDIGSFYPHLKIWWQARESEAEGLDPSSRVQVQIAGMMFGFWWACLDWTRCPSWPACPRGIHAAATVRWSGSAHQDGAGLTSSDPHRDSQPLFLGGGSSDTGQSWAWDTRENRAPFCTGFQKTVLPEDTQWMRASLREEWIDLYPSPHPRPRRERAFSFSPLKGVVGLSLKSVYKQQKIL